MSKNNSRVNRRQSSLLNGCGYENAGNPVKPSEWLESHQGESLNYDGTIPTKERSKPDRVRKHKMKHSDPKPGSLLNYNYGRESVDASLAPSSQAEKADNLKHSAPKPRSLLNYNYGDDFTASTDSTPFSAPDKPHKAKQSTPSPSFMLDDGRKGLIPSRQPVAARPPSSPPPKPLPPPPTIPTMARPVIPDVTETAYEDEIKNLALRIARDFAEHEKIVLVGGALYAYNGAFYSLLSNDDILRSVLRLYWQELGQTNTFPVLKNVASLLRLCVTREYEEFPANEHIIVFENGTLEIATGRFRENSPDDLASSALAISYDPGRKEMPWTEYFLKTIAAGDDALFDLLLQVIGYITSNDVKAKAFLYLEGVGDAGKSRFCDLVASFFPKSGANKVARIALQDFGKKFAMGNLVNAKLNISEDLPDSPLSPTTVSRIKMISDTNRLEAEAKYVQPFSFRPLCKLLFASNHPLRLKEYDAAFVNRVVYIPFLHPIPKDKQDRNILEKMQEELPALFNRAFKAYRRLVDSGYAWAGAERFKPRIFVTSSSNATGKEQVLRRFVADCCVLDEDATTSTADLQAAYNQFCRDHTYLPVQGDRFSRELSAVLPGAVTRVKIGNQRRGFRGIRLKALSKLSEFDNLDDDFE